MGIAVDWPALKQLYDDHDLPPALCAHAWRESIPIYEGERQVGYATSGAWSPRLKEALAIVTLELPYAKAGTRLAMEWTVEHPPTSGPRHRARAALLRSTAQEEPRMSRRVPKTWDAIVVGGGHNGLACAAYLARAGRSVLVLERRHVLGGAAVSEEVHPGFTYSVCSYVVSLLRPWLIRDLDLPRHGLEIIPLEAAFSPYHGRAGRCVAGPTPS